MISNYDGFIFDLDGTIYLDDKIIVGADTLINKIKKLGKKVVFISNKTTGTTTDYHKFLSENNFNIKQSEIVNSTVIIKKYLSEHYYSKYFYAIGEKVFIKEIKDAGLKFCQDPNMIDIIIVTLDRTLNYSKLEIAAKALDLGAKFYAANIDNTCPVEGGEILDAGSTISALEKRTNRKLEMHFGKPSKFMLNEALRILDVNPNKCLIVGDRNETDIAMGNKFNIDTALVSTGVFNNYQKNGKYKPTYKLNSVTDLLKKTIG
jgi:HAD superfamily hydrolase (TIGR01450 family)